MIQNIFKNTLERKACFSAGIEVNRPLDILPGAEEIRVLLLGDWGSGSIEQKNIAEKSAITCDQLGCDLVLMMGDNFIQHGVENLDDPQFQEKFEKVYTQKVPFYPVLGNHDLQGNWRAQVEYTNHSDRWTMPDSSYDFLGGPVQFMGI
ncbi:MAG: metallophosphoesterase, partial [SAR324 cluster bacterium]|nr:metallophosphoesterase [SAR324 cluster bacterium]